MVFFDNHPNEKLQGQPKGLKQILQERGKWPNGGLLLECKACKEKKMMKIVLIVVHVK